MIAFLNEPELERILQAAADAGASAAFSIVLRLRYDTATRRLGLNRKRIELDLSRFETPTVQAAQGRLFYPALKAAACVAQARRARGASDDRQAMPWTRHRTGSAGPLPAPGAGRCR